MNNKDITVADLIAFLQTVPSDAKVRVLKDIASPMSPEACYKMQNLKKFDLFYNDKLNAVSIG